MILSLILLVVDLFKAKPRKVVKTAPPRRKNQFDLEYYKAKGAHISDMVWERAKQGTGKFNDVC